MSRRQLKQTQRWWYQQIEERAHARLAQLRARPADGGPPLWDGEPPVPVEHIAEHLLRLSIVYDVLDDAPGREVLGCLRPERREIVLNERQRDRFERVPGSERHTIAHECGHADLYGAVVLSHEQPVFPELQSTPARQGDVFDTVARESYADDDQSGVADIADQLASLPPRDRTEVLIRFETVMRERERVQMAAGADSPRVRRAVDYYAATLLMPESMVKREAAGFDLTRRQSHEALAARFQVSRQSLLIQLRWLGLIHDVLPDGQVVMRDPKEVAQPSFL